MFAEDGQFTATDHYVQTRNHTYSPGFYWVNIRIWEDGGRWIHWQHLVVVKGTEDSSVYVDLSDTNADVNVTVTIITPFPFTTVYCYVLATAPCHLDTDHVTDLQLTFLNRTWIYNNQPTASYRILSQQTTVLQFPTGSYDFLCTLGGYSDFKHVEFGNTSVACVHNDYYNQVAGCAVSSVSILPAATLASPTVVEGARNFTILPTVNTEFCVNVTHSQHSACSFRDNDADPTDMSQYSRFNFDHMEDQWFIFSAGHLTKYQTIYKVECQVSE